MFEHCIMLSHFGDLMSMTIFNSIASGYKNKTQQNICPNWFPSMKVALKAGDEMLNSKHMHYYNK